MAPTGKEVQLLVRLFESLLNEEDPKHLQTGVSDLFVRIETERGEVALYGDDDELINSSVIFSWIKPEERAISAEMVAQLRQAIETLSAKGFWEHTLFERPFSIVLVDEGFQTLEELLFVDDDLMQVGTPLLEGLNEDLSKFLDNLLAELK